MNETCCRKKPGEGPAFGVWAPGKFPRLWGTPLSGRRFLGRGAPSGLGVLGPRLYVSPLEDSAVFVSRWDPRGGPLRGPLGAVEPCMRGATHGDRIRLGSCEPRGTLT